MLSLKSGGAALLVAGVTAWSAPAYAGTPAGQVITNKATATYNKAGGGTNTVDSNTVSLKVDELLNVSVAKVESSSVSVAPSDTNKVLTFTVKNEGNGEEAFSLTADGALSGDDFDITTYEIWIDTNNDGTFNSADDTKYVKGTNDPTLAAGASKKIFIVSTIPSTPTNGQTAKVSLTATAVTGSGTAGTVFAGKGTDSTDAVVGATTASASDNNSYVVSAATGSVSLTKSAAVSDIYGGTSKIPGSTITYTIVATVSGSGGVTGLVITDSKPANTTYVASSITLDGAAQTDADDSDKSKWASDTLTVNIGDLSSGSKTIKFKVKVD